MEASTHLLVLTGAGGRTFALGSVESGGCVIDDLDDGRRVGRVGGDLDMHLIEVDGEPFILFAGIAERAAHRWTVIEGPDDAPGHGHPYPVKNGVWMSWPMPFRPGMRVTAIWQEGGFDNRRELFRLTSPPLHPDELSPMFGPGWTGYAPRGG